jgi:hypothetical protein
MPRQAHWNPSRFPRKQFKAHHADETAADDSSSPESASEAEKDEVDFVCKSRGPDDEFEDLQDCIEQVIVCCYLAAGMDLEDSAVCEEIAEDADYEVQACYSQESAQSRAQQSAYPQLEAD